MVMHTKTKNGNGGIYISDYELEYYIKGCRSYEFFYPDIQFYPEDVQPYYDLWDNGEITLYINVDKEKGMFPFSLPFFNKKRIVKCVDADVFIQVVEIPERRYCENQQNNNI